MTKTTEAFPFKVEIQLIFSVYIIVDTDLDSRVVNQLTLLLGLHVFLRQLRRVVRRRCIGLGLTFCVTESRSEGDSGKDSESQSSDHILPIYVWF